MTELKESPVAELSETKQFVITLFSEIASLVSASSYTKQSGKILSLILDDLYKQKMILLVSTSANEKKRFLNQLLNRTIVSVTNEDTLSCSYILNYGTEEKIVGYFLDGQVAEFTLDQLSIFTNPANESAYLLQEGLEYLDVYIHHDLLRQVTLIDVPPLSKHKDEPAYLSPAFLQRADEVFWVTNHGGYSEREQRLMRKIEKMKIEQTVVTATPSKIEEELPITTKLNAQDASQILIALLAKENFEHHRVKRIMYRLLRWLERFYVEIANLVSRDPYVGSYNQLQTLLLNPSKTTEFGPFNEVQYEINHIIAQYEQIQTLYQFAQFIRQHTFIDREPLLQYMGLANQYMETVHHYRKNEGKYQELTTELEHLNRKMASKLLLPIFTKELDKKRHVLEEQIEEVNDEQLHLYKKIERFEKEVLHNFDKMKKVLYQCVVKELKQYTKMDDSTHTEKKHVKTRRYTAEQRLKSFDHLYKAKEILIANMPKILTFSQGFLSTIDQQTLQQTLSRIEALRMDYPNLLDKLKAVPEPDQTITGIVVKDIALLPLNSEHIRIKIEKPLHFQKNRHDK